jgi:hypothetical protein
VLTEHPTKTFRYILRTGSVDFADRRDSGDEELGRQRIDSARLPGQTDKTVKARDRPPDESKQSFG